MWMHAPDTGSPHSCWLVAGRQRKWREIAPFAYIILTGVLRRTLLSALPIAAIGRLFGFLFEHDLFGKPLHTFPDHALQTGGELT